MGSKLANSSQMRHPDPRRRAAPIVPFGPSRPASLRRAAVSERVRDYLTVAIFSGVAVGLLAGVLAVGKLLRPVRPQGDKYLTYESAVDPVGDGWAQSPIRYYVFALLFVLFDVE